MKGRSRAVEIEDLAVFCADGVHFAASSRGGMGRLGNWQCFVRLACILLPVLERVAVSQTQLRNLSGSGSRGADGCWRRRSCRSCLGR